MRQEAVALSYLEWVRLIGTGAIRLAEERIYRWRPDAADHAEVVAELMLRAPDLGTSATSFVLAMLKPEVLDRIREGRLYLGARLELDAVRSFHSFSDSAVALHRHDAEVAGIAIDLTPLAAGWSSWVAAVEAADRRSRGEALLAILGVAPCDRFGVALDRLTSRERCMVPDDFIRARDTMFYGWACVLNAQKVSTGAALILSNEAKHEVEALRRDFDVDQPFLSRAPSLRAFVEGLTGEGERPADLLAMASLKQHERYVIKRDGAALDLASLFDDIRVLQELDVGAAGLLVQALGERLPGELIRALKARGITRDVAPAPLSTSAGEDTPWASDQMSSAEADRPLNPSPLSLLDGGTVLPERPIVLEATSTKSAGGTVAAAIVVSAEAQAIAPDDALKKPQQEADVTSGQLALTLGDQPLNPEAVSSAEAAVGLVHQEGSEAKVAAKSNARKTRAPRSKGGTSSK